MATLRSSLTDQVEAIQSRDDLVGFIRDLTRDLQANPHQWENGSLGAYLEALAAWTEDQDGYSQNRGEAPPETPNWKHFGEMLLAASIYE